MDILALLRMLGALGIVLGLLVGALWVVRRYNIRLPGGMSMGGAGERRLAVVERLAIDARAARSRLIRRDDSEHLVLIAPEGLLLLESGARLGHASARKDHPAPCISA